MRINIFGMGYVGSVSAACLARNGNYVTGIDVDDIKIGLINGGKSPIVEAGLDALIMSVVTEGRLRATKKAIRPADISVLCVGTPSCENGSIDLTQIKKVAQQVGEYVRTMEKYHVIAIRSTVLPGTTEESIIPIIAEYSRKEPGRDFGVCVNPEFMRQGTAIYDYYHPPFTVIGELDGKSGDVMAELYRDDQAPLIRKGIRVAEMIKYSCNAWHALKICFANETGNICKKLGIDSHEVMDIFCKDLKLNLSPYYLTPGFAFGGSCLPKDLRAILYKTKELDLHVPVLSSIMASNDKQIDVAYQLVKATGKKSVGVLGLSFKAGTDDLRESPLVELIERLLGKGYSVSIYDKEVSIARLFGSNKRFIESAIPHISSVMTESARETIENSEVIVLGNKSKDYEYVLQEYGGKKCVIDLVRMDGSVEIRDYGYEGICW